MEESIYASISKIENAKEFLDAISKKYTEFSKCKGPTPWPTPTRGGPTHRLSP